MVAGALRLTFRVNGRPAKDRDPRTYDLYLRARALGRRPSPRSAGTCVLLLEGAAARDAGFAAELGRSRLGPDPGRAMVIDTGNLRRPTRPRDRGGRSGWRSIPTPRRHCSRGPPRATPNTSPLARRCSTEALAAAARRIRRSFGTPQTSPVRVGLPGGRLRLASRAKRDRSARLRHRDEHGRDACAMRAGPRVLSRVLETARAKWLWLWTPWVLLPLMMAAHLRDWERRGTADRTGQRRVGAGTSAER